MGSLDETAAGIAELVTTYERVRAELVDCRASMLRAADELRGRLGDTRHPRVLQALHLTTVAARRAEEASAGLAAAIGAARELGMAMGIPAADGLATATGQAPRPASGESAPPADDRVRELDRDGILAGLPRFGAGGDRTTHGAAVDDTGTEYRLRSGDKARDADLITAANDRFRERACCEGGPARPGRATSSRSSPPGCVWRAFGAPTWSSTIPTGHAESGSAATRPSARISIRDNA